jgi:hypothetical protein
MKLLTFSLLAAIGLMAFAPISTTTTPQDEAAIKAVIEAETKAFFDRNYDAWASYWLQSSHDSQTWNNSDGTVFSSVGWEKVGAGAKAWIAANPTPETPPTITRDNWNFHIQGDMAVVGFVQTAKDATNNNTSHEWRAMVRKDGKWKIMTMNAFWAYPKK